jgi:hypothetical protein
MTARFLAVFLAGYACALGGDAEFDHVVKAIESHYGTRQTHIPFMGLASFAVKVAHPAGTSGFKLAVFDDLRIRGDRDEAELDHFMQTLYSSGLRPLVRVHSRRGGAATYIYAGDAGRSTRLLIAAFDRSEATVIEVKVDANTLMKWINDPDDARSMGPRDERERDER